MLKGIDVSEHNGNIDFAKVKNAGYNNEKFLIKCLDNLQEEIKRLKNLNKNTIKVTCFYNGSIYEIDTQIEKDLKEMEYYFLADNYKNPTKVQFIDYCIDKNIYRGLIIMATVYNFNNNKYEYYSPKNLFKSANKARDEYLKNKEG